MKRLFFLVFLLLVLTATAYAEVQVRDDVAVTGEPVMLAARTKGFILPRGGELVEFHVDGESLGENLSGGDGWAYREFIPEKEGLIVVKVLSGEESGTGYMLALKEGKGIVFIDVQGSLVVPPFSREPVEGSPEAVKELSKTNDIVYLSTELPAVVIRKWLDENGFPEAPLLIWRGGGVFDYVVDKGLKVKAVIGTAAVAESALDQTGVKLFTFERSDHATEVDGWEDIVKSIK